MSVFVTSTQLLLSRERRCDIAVVVLIGTRHAEHTLGVVCVRVHIAVVDKHAECVPLGASPVTDKGTGLGYWYMHPSRFLRHPHTPNTGVCQTAATSVFLQL